MSIVVGFAEAVQEIVVMVTSSSQKFEKATPLNVLDTTKCTVNDPPGVNPAALAGTTVIHGMVVTPLPTEPEAGVLALIDAFAVLFTRV
jgi:hypothetical protein